MHLFCSGHVSLNLQLQLVVLVSCGWLFLIMRVLCFEIMHVLDVVHATVANLNCVSIENFVQFVASGKVCVHEVEKIACDVCLNVFAKWGIEPNNIALPIPTVCTDCLLAQINLMVC